jgi:hypothetical protein
MHKRVSFFQIPSGSFIKIIDQDKGMKYELFDTLYLGLFL